MSNEMQIEIPQFTAKEYKSSSAPYEWLYQYKDDKFMLRQLCEQMKDKAGAVGVRAFMAMWNSYCEMQAEKKGFSLENATNFEDQPLELFSGSYICDEMGVAVMDRYGYEQTVCRHPILPCERLVNIDTGEERLKIAYKNSTRNRTWRELIAEKAVVASSSAILQLSQKGVVVNSENAKALSTYLLELEQLNYDFIPEQKSVGRLGWVGGHGFSPYVEDLVFDGENNFKHIFAAVRPSGDRDTWVEAMKKVRAEKSAGRFFLAASFASVILEPCGLLPFFLHAWGGTEVGKTVGLMIAASVWASPKLGDFITTFNSTMVGQEMMATFLNSLPMCIDELQIQSSSGVREFDKIIYQLTEGVGKTRGAKQGGLQKLNTWRCCFITNGETPISSTNSGGGAINRIIEIECTEKVYSDLVGLCSVINNNFGWAGAEFVGWLQTDGAFERINSLQKEYFHELLKVDSTDKQAASASAILAADHIVTELIFKDGNNLTVEDMEKIMQKKSEVDVNLRAYESIVEMVESNINHFKKNDFGDYQGEVWGKVDTEYYYIIKSIFDREMQNRGFNSAAFLAWAKKKNMLSYEAKRNIKKVRIIGNLINCVCIKKEIPKWEEWDGDPEF
jgi:hypothetical protein